ncbi:polymorphic toxin type 15 domain-containing protein [uncultured Shewanella sp.]|uniref:polymorphic toxin type 15 domain-containing protein n=1 Tax=uncultured Shewanella sp. TaxID=173975 RepID=UPI002632F991|nr:polymorphic toxin type 15 domain-containing protein [uncultured Shewanella sp.]
MSGKVVALHQLMEHEALSIETDFSYLKDNELKAYLATGESLSSLKTALTRGEKLLLLDKPRAPMFIMDVPKAELSTEDRVKIILYSLTPLQVRQEHPAINPAYPKDIIKAIDNRLGTAGGVMVGGNPYKSPSSGSLHPPAEMPKRVPEKVINDPPPKPLKSNIAPTFAMAPNRLVFRLVYDDKEQTKAANVPYTVIMQDGKNTQITGTLDKHGKAEVRPNTNHAAYILFGDEALAAEAQNKLDKAYTKLDNAINNKATQSAEQALTTLNQQQQQQSVAITQAFSDAVNQKLDELNQQSQAFNNQSFLSQSWNMAKAAQSGAASGVTEYLPDLGDFGELLHAADINVTMLIEAIATGDVDALEAKFQAWKERGKQGMWEATETMEMLILLLSDSQGRELIASLPARMLAALPADKVVEMSAYHATQLGMDTAVVSGGTALGTLAGGVGGPIACASLLLAANGRKAGKVLEETVEVLGEMKDALKVIRNNNPKKQLYKKDPTIPREQEDLNTRTFVTPLKEKNTTKHNQNNNNVHPLLTRMKPFKAPCFEPSKNIKKKFKDDPKKLEQHYARQLQHQQNGLNDLSIGEYIDNRDRYKEMKRNGTGKAQEDFRVKFKNKLTKSLKNSYENNEKLDLSPKEIKAKANERAEKIMKDLAALHDPDMIAGGNDKVERMGNKRVNSSLGSQWRHKPKEGQYDRTDKSRVELMDEQVREAEKKYGRDAKLNIQLSRCQVRK